LLPKTAEKLLYSLFPLSGQKFSPGRTYFESGTRFATNRETAMQSGYLIFRFKKKLSSTPFTGAALHATERAHSRISSVAMFLHAAACLRISARTLSAEVHMRRVKSPKHYASI
jgi:hypothetical protein